MRNLAVCHTIIVQKDKKGNMAYNASSPDELALVNGAKYFGYSFLKRDEDNHIHVQLKSGEVEVYQLLDILEFNSDRKRMSVIVRDPKG
jgi:magnesium-transporting ATPase (P-type)